MLLFLLTLSSPPEEALEIISENMSPERRKNYFNGLIKERDSNESLGGSTSSLRANRNWSRLRTGWKDAVKAELSTSFASWEAQRRRDSFWKMLAENYTLPS